MNCEEYIKLFKSKENENKILDLKNSIKIDKDGKLNFDDLLPIVVGFANRDGGYLVIGINDNGDPEGRNIFDKYSTSTKSGIDKVKEFIINSCNDRISPVLDIDLDFYCDDKYEFLVVRVPQKKSIPHALIKKKGEKIHHRDYYIKNSHSCTLITDSQLEWLFNSKNHDIEENHYLIQTSTYKNMGGIPESLNSGRIGDWVIVQPGVIDVAQQIIHEIYDNSKDRIIEDSNYRKELFSEIILYCIIKTIDGYGSRIIRKEAKLIPHPPEEFLLCNASKGKEKVLYDVFSNKIEIPDNTKIRFEKENDVTTSCIIENDYCRIKILLSNTQWKVGLPGSNPYGGVMREQQGIKLQDAMHDRYESYTFQVSTSIERKFPDVFDKTYYDTMTFCEKINKSILKQWDMNYFMKEYPHYKKLYSIEYKIDQLYKEISNVKKRGIK